MGLLLKEERVAECLTSGGDGWRWRLFQMLGPKCKKVRKGFTVEALEFEHTCV